MKSGRKTQRTCRVQTISTEHRENDRRWRFTLGFVQVAGPIILAVLGVVDSLPLWVATHQEQWVYVTASLTLIAYGVTFWALQRADPRQIVVDCLLEDLASEIWEKDPKNLQGADHQHRITLFELRKRGRIQRLLRRKWSQVLVSRTRMPRSGRRPRRVFKVDHHVSECGEGVCGLVFSEGSAVVKDLPELHEGDVTDQVFRDYAKRTADDERKVKSERYYARTIGGITLSVDGARWGVLMLDSPDPAALSHASFDKKAARRALRVLTSVLTEFSR